MTTRRKSHRAALLLSVAFAIACGSEPLGGNTEHTHDVAPADVADAPLLLTSQEFELEPGHKLTVSRYADDTVTFAEVGTLDVHNQWLGDEPGAAPLADVLQKMAPDAKLDPRLTAALRELVPDGKVVREEVAPPPDFIASRMFNANGEAVDGLIHKAAPISTDVPKKGNVGNSTNYSVLRCSDHAMRTCLPMMTRNASTYWDYGGYFRTLAFNKATAGNATFTVSRWNGSAGVAVDSMTLRPGEWGQLHYLSAGPGWAMGSIAGPTGAHVGISGLMTNVAPRAQENNNWCWLATAQMALSAFMDPPEQCVMGADHWDDRPRCCDDIAACDGRGEVVQALQEQGWAFTHGISPNSALQLEQALQNGPVSMHQPSHYTLLTDYTERFEGGRWVPYALKLDPAPARNYNLESRHMEWVRLSEVGTGNGGYADAAQGDIHSFQRGNLVSRISRVSWDGATTTFYFDAPGATSFRWEVYDGGLSSGNGARWHSGTVAYSDRWNTTGTKASFTIGEWLWYNVRVQACNGSTCGSWVTARSVSKRPNIRIDSLTWANDVLTARVSASGASPETKFRYRFVDSGNATMMPWRTGEVAGTASRFASSATTTFGVGINMSTKFQVQACNQNGCSGWVERSLYTGS